MKLPKQAIDEFKEIYKRQMKADLTDEEAEFYANEMMSLMLLAQPLHSSKIINILNEENPSINSPSNESRTNKTFIYKDIFQQNLKKQKSSRNKKKH